MSVKFDDFLKEQLQDEEFRKEYEALQPERAVMQAIIDARRASGLTQKRPIFFNDIANLLVI